MNRKTKKKIVWGILIACLVVLLGVAGYLVFKTININNAGNTLQQLQASDTPEPDPNDADAPVILGDPNVHLDTAVDPDEYFKLIKENPEVYAWLYIPDTNISLPVLQSGTDDNFYLDHDVYKNYSFPGAIYSQAMNSRDFLDRVTVLYGHNMADGSMFADLHKFEEKKFFDAKAHEFFYVFDKVGKKLTYQVVSAHGFDSRHIMNSYDFKKNDVFKSWLDSAANPRSTYGNARKGITLDLNSHMLVLSTCENGGDGRFLLQGVLVGDERAYY